METNKITYGLIDQYLQGKLDDKAMHELELNALSDPFLADALEGYQEAGAPATRELSILQRQLEERIALQQERKNAFHFSWQRISIAAAASILFISASILFWMKGYRRPANKTVPEKTVDVSLTHPDRVYRKAENKQILKSNPAPVLTKMRKDVSKGKIPLQKSLPVTDPQKATIKSSVAGPVAQPVGGWNSYRAYVKNNTLYTIKAKKGVQVKVGFSLDGAGNPVDITVLKGAAEVYNREAVRLVKEGPSWRAGSTRMGQVTISFEE